MECREEFHICEDRLLEELKKQGSIGWVEGIGLCRQGYTEPYYEVRDYVEDLMKKAGLEVRTDAVGNIFGCWKGTDKDGGILLTGSHLDSVYGGGIYDGQYGVFGALEAVRSLKEAGYCPKHSIEVAGFIAEEGGPLGGTFGSRAFCGLADPDQIAPEVLTEAGLTKEDVRESKANLQNYRSFVEMHIEQGPVLDRNLKCKLGIPTGIVGILRYRCKISGAENHAGTTPMKERKDALKKMFSVLDKWINLVVESEDIVCNVANIKNVPDQIGVISGSCEFLVEIRSQKREREQEAADWLRNLLNEIAGDYEMEEVIDKLPVRLDNLLIENIEQAARSLGIESQRMPSGASHDAASLGKKIPTAMIFVPSKDGISHNKEEYTAPEELVAGVKILGMTLKRMDQMD